MARDDTTALIGVEIPVRFDWGYALAWHQGDEIKVVSATASNEAEKVKLVDEISSTKFPGFCSEVYIYRQRDVDASQGAFELLRMYSPIGAAEA